MKRPQILFLNRYFHPDESATSQLLSDLAFGLVERGFDVQVMCSRQLYGDPGSCLPDRETIDGVTVHRLWTTRFGRGNLLGRALDYLTFYLSCAVALLWRLRRDDLVIAMTDPPLISVVAAVAAACKGAVLANWVQDVFPEVATQLSARPLPILLDRALCSARDYSLRAARTNVVIGRRMELYLAGRGASVGGLVVAENWAVAGSPEFKPACDSELRSRIGLTGQFVVAYSGNLGRAHEYRIFFETARTMKDDPDIAFLFIGGGIHMTALRALVDAERLPNVRFLPYQAREVLHDSLAAADVHLVSLLPVLEGLVVPSKFYGILAVGRPVVFVGDPAGELARVIEESRCGLVVEAGNAAMLAQAIGRLKSRPAERDGMGIAARELLRARFDKSRAIERWTEIVIGLQEKAGSIR